jgi:hypothetical protein
MVLGVVIIGTMVYKPPKSAIDVALYGVGTAIGLMVTDKITSGEMVMAGGSGCGCSKV